MRASLPPFAWKRSIVKHVLSSAASILTASLCTFALVACGPSVNGGGNGDDQSTGDDDSAPDAGPGPNQCVPTENAESNCGDHVDSDCDGWYDCDDVDCSGVGDCPVCGEASDIEGQPVALPDDGSCTNNYTSTIDITGFQPGQTIQDVSEFLGVCVTMEHSWLRDLQIELVAPNGTVIVLQEFLGTTGSEVFMGQPNESDEGGAPVPGVGATYCWTPVAINPPMLDYCNANGTHDLPPGDYQAVSGFNGLVGTELDGNWTIRVEDCWSIDNGFIFDWTLKFDTSLVTDCSHPIG